MCSYTSHLYERCAVCRYNWIIICVLTLSFTISAIASAANALSSAYKFVVIWNMLLLIAYSVVGTLILRKVCAA